MKIQVKDLEPNPYRNMPDYPIDEGKIKALVKSIKSTTFWDNILVRKHNGKYQIAYGHHRWIALQRLKIKEIDVPVRKFTEREMLTIMAVENMENGSTNPAIINCTIAAAKKFLVDNPAIAKTIKPAKQAKADKQSKEAGVLYELLQANFSISKIIFSLVQLELTKNKKIASAAIKELDTQQKSVAFVKAVKQYEEVTGETPKTQTQKKVAKQYTNGTIKAGELYGKLVTETYPNAGPKSPPKIDFRFYLNETNVLVVRLNKKLLNIHDVFAEHPLESLPQAEAAKLFSSIGMLGMQLKEMKLMLNKRTTKRLKGKTK